MSCPSRESNHNSSIVQSAAWWLYRLNNRASSTDRVFLSYPAAGKISFLLARIWSSSSVGRKQSVRTKWGLAYPVFILWHLLISQHCLVCVVTFIELYIWIFLCVPRTYSRLGNKWIPVTTDICLWGATILVIKLKLSLSTPWRRIGGVDL
jgi:hypothetical protein